MALAAYPRLPPGSDVVGWLVVIAHRKAVDQHRRAARAPLPVERLPERPSRTGLPGEGEPDLWAAVAALPPKQRAAVAHHHLAGLPHADVGRLLGTSEAAARRSASDGIRSLRASYPRGER